ncbi:hypothetical protein SRHO_G00258160 [Serrasalmus rhombeus]
MSQRVREKILTHYSFSLFAADELYLTNTAAVTGFLYPLGYSAMQGSSSSAPTVPEPAVVEPGSTEGGTAISEGQAAEVSGCSEPVSAEVVMLEAVAEVDMVDEPVFKVPAKRKKRGKGKGNKQLKKELSGADADTDSEGSLSDSGWSACSEEQGLPVRYTAEEIKKFLSAKTC